MQGTEKGKRDETMTDRLLKQLTKKWRFFVLFLTYLCLAWSQDREKAMIRGEERGEGWGEGWGERERGGGGEGEKA